MKVLPKSFHLNGHTTRFLTQTQKLEPPYKTLSSTLEVKEFSFEVVGDKGV